MAFPDKLFYKIGEVADIVGVKPHVLRYWEVECPFLQPVKSRGNQRLYRHEHVEQLLLLKDLIYRQGMTLAGASKQLKAAGRSADLPLFSRQQTLLQQLRRDLVQLRDALRRPMDRN
jgi:DNA-binding transcriptional MerR regulator